jgi:hypothetical protein
MTCDLEPLFICQVCGQRGADVRPNFDWEQEVRREGGTPDQYRAALARTIKLGWLWLYESGTYVKFTPAGAELFT